jgi:hypothetical protein
LTSSHLIPSPWETLTAYLTFSPSCRLPSSYRAINLPRLLPLVSPTKLYHVVLASHPVTHYCFPRDCWSRSLPPLLILLFEPRSKRVFAFTILNLIVCVLFTMEGANAIRELEANRV